MEEFRRSDFGFRNGRKKITNYEWKNFGGWISDVGIEGKNYKLRITNGRISEVGFRISEWKKKNYE